MFKVSNKDTRTTPLASFWCLSCQLWIYFTPCSSVSNVNFEHVNTDWRKVTSNDLRITTSLQQSVFFLKMACSVFLATFFLASAKSQKKVKVQIFSIWFSVTDFDISQENKEERGYFLSSFSSATMRSPLALFWKLRKSALVLVIYGLQFSSMVYNTLSIRGAFLSCVKEEMFIEVS